MEVKMQLEWIWFCVLTAVAIVSVGHTWLSFYGPDSDGDDPFPVSALVGTMSACLSLVVSWPVLGYPFLQKTEAAMPMAQSNDFRLITATLLLVIAAVGYLMAILVLGQLMGILIQHLFAKRKGISQHG